MVIQKTQSYRTSQPNKVNITLDRLHFDILCKYVLQASTIVRMEQLTNVHKLMSMIDPATYENDPEKVKRVYFIVRALEARLKNGINDRELIISYVNGGITFPIDWLDYDHLNLNPHEIDYINKFILETINYQFIYERLDRIQDIVTRFKTADFGTKGAIVQEFESLIDELKTEFRHNQISDNIVDMVFSLADGMFENTVTNVWNIKRNPSRRLITGMQAFNDMLGGGFESGRFYMIMGASGIGKSLTLLNIMYQIKKYNTNVQTKDPFKKPCIVLLTMENSVIETVTRLFDLVVGNNEFSGMENYDIQEVLRILREEGQLVLNDSSPINIYIKYKPSRSVSTSYYYTLYDDLLDEGYEMICMIEDHIKKIRSAYSIQDIRIELGEIVNESKAFAVEKDIPFISNTHLNREATKLIEDAMNKNRKDVGKQLGKSYAGESLLMVENMDVGITIALDFDQEQNRYITVNLAKMRDLNKSPRTYFAQPFVQGSTIRLVEDLGGVPQFKETLHAPAELNQNTVVRTSSASSLLSEMTELLSKSAQNDENAFERKTYSMTPNREVHDAIKFFDAAIPMEPMIRSPIIFFDQNVA